MAKKKNGLKEFYRSGREDALGWALVFFWGALIVLAELTGLTKNWSWWDGWSMFFIGFGIIALIGAPLLLYAGNSKKAVWNFVFGVIFLAIGLGDFLNFGWIWVVILAGIGFAILRGAFKKK